MPDLAPFRGLRYSTGPDLTAVTAPPYDVIDDEQRAELAARDENNSVRLILPEAATGDAYVSARRTLDGWRADGTLVPEDHPALYAYRMQVPQSRGGQRTVGVIGALALPDRPDDGEILPHERTLPKAKSDRLALLRATRANFDPIWALSLAAGLHELVEDVPVVAAAEDAGGVRHELGVVDDDDRIAAVRALLGRRPMVLADGHHRFSTACSFRAEGGGDGAEAILCLVMSLDDAQVDVLPFHRLVHGAPPDLRGRLRQVCDVRDVGPATTAGVASLVEEMDGASALGLVDRDGLAVLVPGAGLEEQLADLPVPLRGVDAARFDVGVRPLLDGATLGYRSDAARVAATVGSGGADAAILLRGVNVDQIRAAADARVLMPEKTTYFAPKPLTGMVMRSLDDR